MSILRNANVACLCRFIFPLSPVEIKKSQWPMSLYYLSQCRCRLGSCRPVQFKAYIPLRRKIPGVGGWRWAMPPTPEFSVGDTDMLVYFGVTDAKPKICVTPHANPRRQSVEYRWCWVPNANFLRWPCTFFFFFFFRFHSPFLVEYGLKKLPCRPVDFRGLGPFYCKVCRE